MFRYLSFHITRLSEKTCFSVPFPVIFCIVYFTVQGISFAQFKSGGDIDTTEMLLYTQYWDWGYGGSQPPLYSWLALIVIEWFGLSLLSLSLIKFAMLCIAFVAVYAIARKIGLSPLASAGAMLGIFAIPVIGWEAQRSLSHSSALLAFTALGILAFIHAAGAGTIRSYLAFGLALACAVLSKYNALILFTALIIAGLSLKPWRRAILSGKFAAALLAAGALVTPHFLWAYHHPSATLARSSKFNFHAGGNALLDFLWGLKSFVCSNLLMMSILGIVAVITAIRLKVTIRQLRLPRRHDPASLFFYLIVISQAMIAVGLVVSGATALPNRWLQPIMLFFPLAVAILFTRPAGNSVDFGEKCTTLFTNQAAVGLVCALIMIFALPLTTVYKKSAIPKANQLNYAKLHAEIKNALGGNPATIVVTDYSIFANLRLYQPDLKIIHPFIANPKRLNQASSVILWEGHGPMPFYTKETADKAGITTDHLHVARTRLGRLNNPKISLATSYAYDSKPVRR